MLKLILRKICKGISHCTFSSSYCTMVTQSFCTTGRCCFPHYLIMTFFASFNIFWQGILINTKETCIMTTRVNMIAHNWRLTTASKSHIKVMVVLICGTVLPFTVHISPFSYVNFNFPSSKNRGFSTSPKFMYLQHFVSKLCAFNKFCRNHIFWIEIFVLGCGTVL